jgi:hypothetical protein
MMAAFVWLRAKLGKLSPFLQYSPISKAPDKLKIPVKKNHQLPTNVFWPKIV